MSARDTGQPDIIESGPGAPRRSALGLAAVLIAAAATGGYLFGSRHREAPVVSSAAPAEAQPILATGKRCSVQLKDRLQLGIEIANQSAAAVTLHGVQPILPLDGLRATATTWGGCGQLPPTPGGDAPLPAGATTWLTITFEVLAVCPGPLPVRFSVDYGSGTAELPGFPDLGGVPYTSAKCPSDS